MSDLAFLTSAFKPDAELIPYTIDPASSTMVPVRNYQAGSVVPEQWAFDDQAHFLGTCAVSSSLG